MLRSSCHIALGVLLAGANAFVTPRQSSRLSLTLAAPRSHLDANGHNAPGGLDDLYSKLDLLLRELDAKDALFEETVNSLRQESEQKDTLLKQTAENLQRKSDQTLRSQNQGQDFNSRNFYDRKMADLEQKARDMEKELFYKEAEHRQHLSSIQEQSSASLMEAAEQIALLGEQLDVLKHTARQQQVAASEDAKHQATALQLKLETLEKSLARETAAKDFQSTKVAKMRQRQQDIEKELTNVQQTLQKRIDETQANYEAEKETLVKEQQAIQQQLVAEQDKARKEIADVSAQSEAQQASLRSSLKAKEEEYSSSLNQVRESSQRREKELSDSLGALGTQLQNVKFESHKALMAEKAASEEKQRELRDLIKAKELELQQATQQTSALKSKADELLQQRIALEKEVTELKSQYETAEREWDRRFKAADEFYQSDRVALKEALSKQQSEMKDRLDAIRAEAEFHKAAMESGLAEKDRHYTQVIEQLHAGARKTESQLREKLEVIAKQMETLQTDAKNGVSEEREMALAKQQALLAQIQYKEVELVKQLALTEEANKVAAAHWSKRMEIEEQISSLQHNMDAVAADWEARYRSLQDKLVQERREAEILIAQTEEQARKELAAVTKKVEKQKSDLEIAMRVKDEYYESVIDQIRSDTEKRELEYSRSLDAVGNELQQVKLTAEKKLAEEKGAFLKKQDDLLVQIVAKEKELQAQLDEVREAKRQTQEQSERRERLEKELAELKRAHEIAVSDWGQRYRELEEALQMERFEAEKRLADAEAKSRTEIESVKSQGLTRRAVLQNQLETNEKEYRKTIQQLQDSADANERELARKLGSIGHELQKHRVETQRQLLVIRQTAVSKQNELLDQIQAKENELVLQKEQMDANHVASQEERNQRAKLEFELDALKEEFDSVVRDWETRYKSLEETRLNERRAAETELARMEYEALAQLEDAKREADTRRGLLEDQFKAKEAAHALTVQNLRNDADKEQCVLNDRLVALNDEYQGFQFDVRKQAEADQAMTAETRVGLQAALAELEKKLQEQETLTGFECTRADQMWQKRLELEKDLKALKAKYDSTIYDWETRYKNAVKSLTLEKHSAEALLFRKTFKAREVIDNALQQAADARAKADDVEQKASDAAKASALQIQNLQTMFESKEANLLRTIQQIQVENEGLRKRSGDDARQVKEAASFRESELLSQINAKVREIKNQEALIALERAKSHDISRERVELEGQLSALRTQYDQAISEWKSRVESLEQARLQGETALADQRRLHQQVEETLRQTKEAAAIRERELISQIDAKTRELYDKEALIGSERTMSNDIAQQKRLLEGQLSSMRLQYDQAMADWKSRVEKLEHSRQNDEQTAYNQQHLYHQAEETMRQVKEAAARRERELIVAIDVKSTEIANKEVAIAMEKARSNDIAQQRAALESQVSDLRSQYDQAIAGWKSRVDLLEQGRQEEARKSAELIAQRDAATEKSLQEGTAHAEANQRALKSELDAKVAGYLDEIQALRDLSSKKETELSEKIQLIADDFQRFRFHAQEQLKAQKDDVQTEMRKQVDDAADKGYRLAERAYYDLTRDLVKEVERYRQKGDRVWQDNQSPLPSVPSPTASDPSETTETLMNLKLSGVKDRVAKILRGDKDPMYSGDKDSLLRP